MSGIAGFLMVLFASVLVLAVLLLMIFFVVGFGRVYLWRLVTVIVTSGMLALTCRHFT